MCIFSEVSTCRNDNSGYAIICGGHMSAFFGIKIQDSWVDWSNGTSLHLRDMYITRPGGIIFPFPYVLKGGVLCYTGNLERFLPDLPPNKRKMVSMILNTLLTQNIYGATSGNFISIFNKARENLDAILRTFKDVTIYAIQNKTFIQIPYNSLPSFYQILFSTISFSTALMPNGTRTSIDLNCALSLDDQAIVLVRPVMLATDKQDSKSSPLVLAASFVNQTPTVINWSLGGSITPQAKEEYFTRCY